MPQLILLTSTVTQDCCYLLGHLLTLIIVSGEVQHQLRFKAPCLRDVNNGWLIKEKATY